MNNRENNNQALGGEFEDLIVIPPAGTSDSFSEMVNASYRAGILLDKAKREESPSEPEKADDGSGGIDSDGQSDDIDAVALFASALEVPVPGESEDITVEQVVYRPADADVEQPDGAYVPDGMVEDDVHQEETYRAQEAILARISRGWERLKHEPVVIACLVILLFIVVFVRAFLVPSGSMRPTLVEGDRILSLATYFPNGQTFNRGDIVCFKERNSGQVYVKRVIGKGGDVIEITGEKVYVNGELSDYQGTGGVLTATRVVLGEDQYWVMGDNRGNSEDSRFIGPVSADQMISKVWVLYWPLDHFALL